MSKYVIIGNGITGIMAAKAITELDYGAPITIISTTKRKTITRPGLPYFLEGKVNLERLQRLPNEFYIRNNIQFIEKEVRRIDPITQQIVFTDNKTFPYRKLLIATGSKPLPLNCTGSDRVNILTYNSVGDIFRIQHVLPNVQKIVIIGSGLTGMQLASILAKQEKQVTIIEKENHILSKNIPTQLIDIITSQYRKLGINFIINDEVKHCGGVDNKLSYVETKRGTRLETQLVISCAGNEPNKNIIEKAKIRKRQGILVNAALETSQEGIWAAGSVAEIEQDKKNAILPFYDTSIRMGIVAGKNMAGGVEQFSYKVPIISQEINDKQLHLIGSIREGKGIDTHEEVNRLQGTYMKIYTQQNVMVGAITYGIGPSPLTFRQIIASESPIQIPKKLSSAIWEEFIRV